MTLHIRLLPPSAAAIQPLCPGASRRESSLRLLRLSSRDTRGSPSHICSPHQETMADRENTSRTVCHYGIALPSPRFDTGSLLPTLQDSPHKRVATSPHWRVSTAERRPWAPGNRAGLFAPNTR